MRVATPTHVTDGDVDAMTHEVSATHNRVTRMKKDYLRHPLPEWAFDTYRLAHKEYQRAYRWKQKMDKHMQLIFMVEDDDARMKLRIEASEMAKEILWSSHVVRQIHNHFLRTAKEYQQDETEYDRERLEDEMDFARNL
jgi:hypothetical protein